ncbi:MAG: hypothetical protein N838_07965 [Thiohalocapsa sp. PB-PSB1]|nr:MAG: hypothetical protein N838_07965 [Thiohalocapsa sp. PB-PSB1]
MTTTIKAFHGDRGFLRLHTVTVPAAPPVAAAVRYFSSDRSAV